MVRLSVEMPIAANGIHFELRVSCIERPRGTARKPRAHRGKQVCIYENRPEIT